MSNNEITAKVRRMKRLQAKADELDAEIKAIQDEIKAEIKAPTAAIQMLRDYRAWQNERRERMGDRWEEHDRVFTRDDGKPIHPDTITGWFSRFIKRSDLPDISIHSLRHTNATLLINSGIPITTISARLGHANPSTTTKIYTHAIQSADAAAADALDTIFSGERKQAPPSNKTHGIKQAAPVRIDPTGAAFLWK
ncbi:MAG: site-specific integrase [Ruminococcus sp.]|nr:site-specific integrase [Ruminococcus sp.]